MKPVKFLLLALAILRLTWCEAEAAPSPARESQPLDYVIVVTGGELLEGVYPDAHTPFLTRTLRPLGCRCKIHREVAAWGISRR